MSKSAKPTPREKAAKGTDPGTASITPKPAVKVSVKKPSPARRKKAEAGASDVVSHSPAASAACPPAAEDAKAVEARPVETPNEDGPSARRLRPVLALGVEEGLFLIVAAAADIGEVKAICRFEAEPLPRLVSADGYLASVPAPNQLSLHIAYVPWPHKPDGTLQLGCVCNSGKPLLTVQCTPYTKLEPRALLLLLARFGNALKPAFESVLPAQHALRQQLAKSSSVPSKGPLIQGSFDGLIDGLAHGWAWSPDAPRERLNVEVWHQGEVVGTGRAERYRDDLQANGIGDGCCHFRLTLSYELFDGQAHEISVRVADGGSGQRVSGSPALVTFEASQPKHLDWIPRREALQLLKPLAEQSQPGNAQALQAALRGACLKQETWLLEDAREQFEKLLGVLGPNALCHCKVAESWLLDHKLAPALASYRAAIAADPGFMWAHLGLGNVLRMQGLAGEAREAYRAAWALAPGHAAVTMRLEQVQPEVLSTQARLAAAKGNKAEAKALLQALVLEQPDNDAACGQLDVLLCDGHGDALGTHPLPAAARQAERARRLLDAVMDEVERRLHASGAAIPG